MRQLSYRHRARYRPLMLIATGSAFAFFAHVRQPSGTGFVKALTRPDGYKIVKRLAFSGCASCKICLQGTGNAVPAQRMTPVSRPFSVCGWPCKQSASLAIQAQDEVIFMASRSLSPCSLRALLSAQLPLLDRDGASTRLAVAHSVLSSVKPMYLPGRCYHQCPHCYHPRVTRFQTP